MLGNKALEQSKPSEQGQPKQAEAALQLLRSLAKSGEDPEMFMQACLDWSRLSDDAMSLPDFMSVLSMLSGPAKTRAQEPSNVIAFEYAAKDVFSLDKTGTIINISQELSDRLNLPIGSTLLAYLRSVERQDDAETRVIEISDRFGIKRLIQIYPITHAHGTEGYLARAMLTRLVPNVRRYLKTQSGLTNSELDILEQVLQRHSLEQVAQMRGNKMNTIRTHVARLIQKLECHSLVEAVATTMELTNALTLDSPLTSPSLELQDHAARHIALNTPDSNLEYRRYGNANGTPVLVLHSLEYGYLPSSEMIDQARRQDLNLIFPVRPGFGASTSTETLDEAAIAIADFIKILNLQEVILVGLSTAAPLALAIQDVSPRIRHAYLVNYGLNVGDKLKAIQPKWIGGMLRMALTSSASFTFGIRSVRSMIRTFGGLRFYRMLYRSQDSDQAYLESHPNMFRTMSDYLSSADRDNVRLDIETAFMKNPQAEAQLAGAVDVTVINSTDQHGVGPEDSMADAKRLEVGFRHVPHPGRNWMFQHPESLFKEIIEVASETA
ncbi:MAG: alpha/beta hydrolase [Hyphomonadaceae bacterium]|nr:alpha/beta hydrolase [Hyphomonadaceae bacterium]